MRDGTTWAEVCIAGNTASGLAVAASAARYGATCVIVGRHHGPGGVLPSLGAVETHYRGSRSPFLDEFRERVRSYYETTYGLDSEQYRTCAGHYRADSMMTFEPRVGESVLGDMLRHLPNVELLTGYRVADVEVRDGVIVAATFSSLSGDQRTVRAHTYVDATDEGDLAACTGVACRIGRESRGEFDEPHAGIIFTTYVPGAFPVEAARGELNLTPKWTTRGLLPGSTGQGDNNVQDYSYRLCLTNDPGNRVAITRPSDYDRERFAAIAMTPEQIGSNPYPLHHRFLTASLKDMVATDHLIHGHQLPNGKRSWNASNLTGAGRAYAEASEATRGEIERQHLNHALGILYFLQHDDAVPPDIRSLSREWGLAANEFVDTHNLPPCLYVREARRIVGRATFTEHDNALAPGLDRAPISRDSIAVTEFPSDSLPCTTERRVGSLPDGQMFLMETSRPGQVPFGAMLSAIVDNLLVPTCLSATHVAWGSLRTTPTQIQIAEAAGCAATLARDRGVHVGQLKVPELQHRLLSYGSMIGFFNDFDMKTEHDWVIAVQFLSAYGYFRSYDARADEPLTETTSKVWTDTTAQLLAKRDVDVSARAQLLPDDAHDRAAAPVVVTAFASAIDNLAALSDRSALIPDDPHGGLTRGAACVAIYSLLSRASLG